MEIDKRPELLKEALRKRDAFNKANKAIEAKYPEAFKDVPSRHFAGQTTILHDYYTIYTDENQVECLMFHDNSLPKHIQYECITAFNEAYNSGAQ